VRVAADDGVSIITFKDKEAFFGSATQQVDVVHAYLDLANHCQLTIT
jgi:hypothetical protein